MKTFKEMLIFAFGIALWFALWYLAAWALVR